MLTQKQHDLLFFIHKNIQDKGVSPSFEEMKAFMNLKSKSGIHRLIQELEQKNFLCHLPNKARSLEVIALPEEKKPFIQSLNIANDNVIEIPLYGKIAAGVPIEAIADPADTICIPTQMIGSGEHYALTVEGDSMKNAGIMDGDTVIIRRCQTAPNGRIVVALVDGYEVTLKRFYAKGSNVALQPENPAYETRIFSADRVEIQGELVGLMRQY